MTKHQTQTVKKLIEIINDGYGRITKVPSATQYEIYSTPNGNYAALLIIKDKIEYKIGSGVNIHYYPSKSFKKFDNQVRNIQNEISLIEARKHREQRLNNN